MKKKLFFAATLIDLSIVCVGQTGEFTDTISAKSINVLINRNFAKVATGQGDAVSLANYGSFDPANGSFKFNFFGALGDSEKKRSFFFNISVGGDIIGDNAGVLFNDSKFNSGMNVLAKIHVPILFNSIEFNESDFFGVADKIKALEDERRIKVANMINVVDTSYINANLKTTTYKLQNLRSSSTDLSLKIDSLKQSIADIERKKPENPILLAKLTDSLLALSDKRYSFFADSLQLQRKLDSLIDLKTIIVADITPGANRDVVRGNYLVRRIKDINAYYDEKRKALEQSLPIPASTFGWLSFVGGYTRKKYFTFFDSLSFVDQFVENKFSAYNFGIEGNFIHFDTLFRRAHYVNLGFSRIRNNDIDEFTTQELTQSLKSASGDSSRTVAKKYNVYRSQITEYDAWKIYVNYYYLFGKSSNFAIHCFPDVEFRDSKKNPLNVGLGFIFTIKNKKDNSIFNIEAYTKFKDIGKALPETQKSFWNRNEIGLQFGLPFYLPQKK